jgi:hypothetical protein
MMIFTQGAPGWKDISSVFPAYKSEEVEFYHCAA